MKNLTYYIIALAALLASCTNADFEYSGYSAYFVFENSAGRSPALASAMNPASPGIFCRVCVEGANYFRFETNQGLSDRVSQNEIDKLRTKNIGLYNATGVIVGFGNLNMPPTFYAYDSQCPNCYEETGLPRYSLTMNTDGTAECGTCHRKYDMNNGGLVVSGEHGDKLIRYHASTTGPQGILSVTN